MAEVVAGIALPPGDAGAIEAAATSLDRGGHGFDVSASAVGGAVGQTTSWEGAAATSFTALADAYGRAGDQFGDTLRSAWRSPSRHYARLVTGPDRSRSERRAVNHSVVARSVGASTPRPGTIRSCERWNGRRPTPARRSQRSSLFCPW